MKSVTNTALEELVMFQHKPCLSVPLLFRQKIVLLEESQPLNTQNIMIPIFCLQLPPLHNPVGDKIISIPNCKPPLC